MSKMAGPMENMTVDSMVWMELVPAAAGRGVGGWWRVGAWWVGVWVVWQLLETLPCPAPTRPPAPLPPLAPLLPLAPPPLLPRCHPPTSVHDAQQLPGLAVQVEVEVHAQNVAEGVQRGAPAQRGWGGGWEGRVGAHLAHGKEGRDVRGGECEGSGAAAG